MRIINSSKKFILGASVAACLSLSSYSANASVANSLFEGLVDGSASSSFQSGGSFNTGVRQVYAGPSGSIRFPTSNVQLISITPPSYSAGCSGIDYTFGSFSFIDGSEIEQLIKNIMANAKGLVIEMGIRLFCPICADVLMTMQDLAQAMNAMQIDSCNAAQSLVSAGADLLGLDGNSQQRSAKSMCSTEYQHSGGSDFFRALSSGCATYKDSVKKLSDWLGGRSTKNSDAAKYADLYGNKTWMVLTDMGISSTEVKELIMNVTGYSSTTEGTGGGDPVTRSEAGWLKAEEAILDLLLTGYNPKGYSNADPILKDFYRQNEYVSDLTYGLCYNKNNQRTNAITSPHQEGTFLMCTQMRKVKVKDLGGKTSLISEFGLLHEVKETLLSAKDKIAVGEALSKKEIALIQISPLPAYRMLNIAAVYPSISEALIVEYSSLIAMLIAEGILHNWIAMPDKITENTEARAEFVEAKQTVKRMLDFLMESQVRHQEVLKGTYQWQESLLANITHVNKAIVREATESGIAGGAAFSEVLSHNLGAMGL